MNHYRKIQLPDLPEALGIVDQPSPMLQWVEIGSMVIDDRYQRPLNRGSIKTISTIAANFRWSCFTPVLLAPIEGGQFAVIDGQHRVHAALMCGIASVPAMVIPIAATEQAMAFVAVNTARTNMSQYNLYRAGLAAGEEWAITARDVVAAADCRLMTFNPSSDNRKPGEICSIGLIRTIIKAGHAASITVALKAIRATDANNHSSVLLYSDWALNPIIRATTEFPGIDAETLADCFRRKRPMLVLDAAERLAKEEKRAVSAVAREMFAALIRSNLARAEQPND